MFLSCWLFVSRFIWLIACLLNEWVALGTKNLALCAHTRQNSEMNEWLASVLIRSVPGQLPSHRIRPRLPRCIQTMLLCYYCYCRFCTFLSNNRDNSGSSSSSSRWCLCLGSANKLNFLLCCTRIPRPVTFLCLPLLNNCRRRRGPTSYMLMPIIDVFN